MIGEADDFLENEDLGSIDELALEQDRALRILVDRVVPKSEFSDWGLGAHDYMEVLLDALTPPPDISATLRVLSVGSDAPLWNLLELAVAAGEKIEKRLANEDGVGSELALLHDAIGKAHALKPRMVLESGNAAAFDVLLRDIAVVVRRIQGLRRVGDF